MTPEIEKYTNLTKIWTAPIMFEQKIMMVFKQNPVSSEQPL